MRPDVITLDVEDEKSGARAGTLRALHGDVPTPAFMPVASAGSVKTVTFGDLDSIGVGAIISNALLLSLRPGEDAVKRAGGLGPFMGYGGVIFTDSGGFQIIRGRYNPRLDDGGIEFNNPYDGSRIRVTPESIVEVQRKLGSDVAMVLDDCPPFPYTPDRLAKGVERTLEWARRCKDAWEFGRTDTAERAPMLFAIVQGGTDRQLREDCARALAGMGFEGFGIGGLSIGEERGDMLKAISWTTGALPRESPRYLMGVGSPPELIDGVARGVDIFDSVYPTRNARHGTAFVPGGTVDMRRRRWAGSGAPLQEDCPCPACAGLTTGYLHHLTDVKELSGMRLLSVHNLTYMARFMRALRRSVVEDEFGKFSAGTASSWRVGGGEPGRSSGWLD